MAKKYVQYEVIRRCQIYSPKTGLRLYKVGEIVELDVDDTPSQDQLKPIGEGPHYMAERNFDIPGYETLSVVKRSEMWATGRYGSGPRKY